MGIPKKYQKWPEHPTAIVVDSNAARAAQMAKTVRNIFPHIEVKIVSDDLSYKLIRDIVGEYPPDLVLIGDLNQFEPHPDFGRSVGRIAILVISTNYNAVTVKYSDTRPIPESKGIDVYYYTEYSLGNLCDGILDVEEDQ
jgi:hypothetical protein